MEGLLAPTPPSQSPATQSDTLSCSLPRIGLSQLEGFRRQLLDVLQRSTKPKVSLLPSLLPGPPRLWAPYLPCALPVPWHRAQEAPAM